MVTSKLGQSERRCAAAAAAMEVVSRKLHIVLCPWLAFGHLLPCLNLAERLALRGHRVSYVATPRNIARLPPVRPAAAAAQLIEFVALSLPRVDGLPDGAESTHDVPYGQQTELLLKAFDGLSAPFSEWLGSMCQDQEEQAAEGRKQKKPDWVIVDSYHHWAAAAASENKVPCAMLVLTSASIIAAQQQQQQQQQRAPEFERKAKKSTFFCGGGASGMSMAMRSYMTIQRCSIIAIRSCREWEPEFFPETLLHFRSKPVIPLGLLPPPSTTTPPTTTTPLLMHWLDAQPSKSVLYVAMGSEVPLSAEQVHELALGLELAGTRFLWALRNPSHHLLPPGFLERTHRHGHGLVLTEWVPQVTLLAHGALYAFLTHCGWNSTIEGLMFGHPLVMLPICNDQGPIARLMEHRKAGVQVPRNQQDGSFDRQGVMAAVRALAVEGSGRRLFAASAKKLQQVAADEQLHDNHLDGFIQRLLSSNVLHSRL